MQQNIDPTVLTHDVRHEVGHRALIAHIGLHVLHRRRRGAQRGEVGANLPILQDARAFALDFRD